MAKRGGGKLARRGLLPQRMNTIDRIELKGLREYQERLLELGDEMVTKGCVVALAPGANLMRDAARRFAPVLQKPDPRRRPGVLKNAIQAVRSRKTQYAATFVVGVKNLGGAAVRSFKASRAKAGQRWSGSFNPADPFYGMILERGKTPRTAHPFLKPGFYSSARAALAKSADTLGHFTRSTIARLGSR